MEIRTTFFGMVRKHPDSTAFVVVDKEGNVVAVFFSLDEATKYAQGR